MACALVAASADLAWVNQDGYRAASLKPAGPGQTGFTAMAAEETGIRFVNHLPAARHFTNQIYLNGSGVAAGDLDGDGHCDLIFGGLSGQSAIYRNLGNWRFQDVTEGNAALLRRLDATGVAAVDWDGDFDLDLIVNTVGQGTHLFVNQGQGRFLTADEAAPLNSGRSGTSCALADIDRDGDLDLYVTNYRLNTMRDEPHLSLSIQHENGQPRVTAYGNRPMTDPDLAHRFKFVYRETPGGGGTVFHDEQGEPDGFFRNNGHGRFEPISFSDGTFLDESGQPLTHPPFDWGLSVMMRDLNGDHAPDIYVCNDFSTPDRIWINDGSGRFRPLPTEAIRQTSLSTMAVDIADVNRDGHDDIFTADMLSPERWRRLVQINQPNPNMSLFVDTESRPQVTRNTLQVSRGDGTFMELAQMAGLEASDWTWASIFLDVDLDGYEDLLVANGFERDFMNMDAHRRVLAAQARVPRGQPPAAKLSANRFYPRLNTANLAFQNLGHLRFREVGAAWGFHVEEVSNGMCLADLDNDGDLDAVLNNLNGRATVLRNETAAPRLAVRLRGRAPNTQGIGAALQISGGSLPDQTQSIIAGGRYLSSDAAMRVFAAGHVSNRFNLAVRWPSGERSRLTNLEPNHIYEIFEPARDTSLPSEEPRKTSFSTMFTEEETIIRHAPPPADPEEFAEHSMLPRSLQAFGPGLAWLEPSTNQPPVLLVTDGPGNLPTFWGRPKNGTFEPLDLPSSSAIASRHRQSGVIGWNTSESSANVWSTDDSPAALLLEWQSQRLALGHRFPWLDNVPGPLAAADLDGDGRLEVFVGGGVNSSRWPESASSVLYRRQGPEWQPDLANSNALHQVGLVSGAVFSDIDLDGDPDLILACAWGPIRILANDKGRLHEIKPGLAWEREGPGTKGLTSLEQLTGWWNGISAGDFDEDGRLDLVASNWGRNSKYERFRERPLRLYFGDFIGDGRVNIVEACYDPDLRHYAPVQDVWTLSRGMPWLLARFPNYASFARVGMEEALGEWMPEARHREAAWLDTTLFLNRGDHFEVRPLPWIAHVAPAFAVAVADFDGDGHEDLFLSQNFFAVRPFDSRFDAGRGLILRGDGRGNMEAVDASRSGLAVYGQQRAAAVCDYDGDGRVDLAVAQHADRVRMFRNEQARPGIRIRLQGPIGNPHAVGAKLRLQSGQAFGPVREIRAGSGYWSQDSPVQIMALPSSTSNATTHMKIEWPGGKTTEAPLDFNRLDWVFSMPEETAPR